jgi:AcrR family transcriptional regulator
MARPRSDIRPRIVDAARTRFLSRGVDGASLREIARDAGTNIGMVVYYFPTKDDLFLAVVEEVYAGVVADLAAILGAGGSARERLRGAFVRLGKASALEIDVIQLIVREALVSSTRLRRIIARFMKGHVPLIIATIGDGIASGEFDASVPASFILIATLGLGALPQLARRASRSVPPLSQLPAPEELADLSIRLLFRAVGKAAVQTPSGRPSRGAHQSRPKRAPTRAGGGERAPRGRRSRRRRRAAPRPGSRAAGRPSPRSCRRGRTRTSLGPRNR